MIKYLPVNTQLGKISGRDAIYLDNFCHKKEQGKFILQGEINGHLCDVDIGKDWIPYKLVFNDVKHVKRTDLDRWLEMDKPFFHESTSFYEITNSLLTEHPQKHFVIQTYDEVFEVVCTNYELLTSVSS